MFFGKNWGVITLAIKTRFKNLMREARSWFKEKEFQRAISAVSSAMMAGKTNADRIEALNLRAKAYLKMERPSDAQKDINEAKDLVMLVDPRSINPSIQLFVDRLAKTQMEVLKQQRTTPRSRTRQTDA
jgi:Flp pilus assembly protein TadD